MYLERALKGTVVVFLLSLIGGLFGYLTRILLARSLTIEEFGLFYSVVTVFMLIAYFTDAGLGQAISRKIVELNIKSDYKKINDAISSVFILQLTLSFVISMVLISLSGFLSVNYFHADVSKMILFFAVWLVTMPVVSMLTYTLYGFKKSELFSFIDASKYLLLFIISLTGLYLGLGFDAPIWAYVLTNILLVSIGLLMVWRVYPKFSLSLRFDNKLTYDLLKFGSMVFISTLAWFVITQMDTMVLTYFTNPSQVALYQVAVPLSALLLYVTNALSLVLYPIASELSVRKNHARLVEGLELIYKYLLVLILPLSLIMFSFPEVMINLLFTSKYLDAVPVLQVLSASAIFFSICLINSSILTAIGKPSAVAKVMLGVAALNLILNVILVPIYGVMGAAVSTFTSLIVGAVVSLARVRREVVFAHPFRAWAVLFAISLLLVALTAFFKSLIVLPVLWKFALISVIIGFTYVVLLFVTRIIELSEIRYLLNSFIK